VPAVARRGRILTDEEEAALLVAASPILKAAVVFSLNTGLRLGEMLSLTWGDVDLERREVTVTAEKAKGKRTRRVPLNESAHDSLVARPHGRLTTDANGRLAAGW
jgi:integrase/recombinase XerD